MTGFTVSTRGEPLTVKLLNPQPLAVAFPHAVPLPLNVARFAYGPAAEATPTSAIVQAVATNRATNLFFFVVIAFPLVRLCSHSMRVLLRSRILMLGVHQACFGAGALEFRLRRGRLGPSRFRRRQRNAASERNYRSGGPRARVRRLRRSLLP